MKQTRLRPISKKYSEQLKKEREVKHLLCECAGGKCEKCHQAPDFRGLAKHEIKSRAQGGDPTDPDNCQLLCGRCHSKEHGIIEVSNG